jgi:hypothetical protein
MDEAGGVFRDPSDGSFGCAKDVLPCFWVRTPEGKWSPYSAAGVPGIKARISESEDLELHKGELDQMDATTREAVIQARRGQGAYRRGLIDLWGKCSVTRCPHVALLRASHIKPWGESTPKQKLDRFNGLLLTPNLDAAFDVGLISFADDGRILISPGLPEDSWTHLGIRADLKLACVYAENRPYLQVHRQMHHYPA